MDVVYPSVKINSSEARIVARLAAQVYESNRSDFDESRTLGIITPYRSQRALIKREIETLGIPALSRYWWIQSNVFRAANGM